MKTAASELEHFRVEIERILSSPEFISSRQLQDFLRYTSQKAILGVTHLEQIEIAQAVLGRGPDFNPVEDASVRKMASHVRQRLDQYYGRRDVPADFVVTLPVRSYIPRLEHRTGEAVPAAEPVQIAVAELPGREPSNVPLALLLATGVLFVAAAFFAYRLTPPKEKTPSASAIVLSTVKGDIIQGGNFAPGAGIQLGPELRKVDEITARLDFTPRMEAQQAGLIIWQDQAHFVRLGRKFFGRNQIEFLSEQGNSAITTSANTVYDGDGQSGEPLWLSIHRDANEYRAYLSRDGIRWEPHGNPIVPAQPFATPHAGIFALNGRREAPSIPASFSHLSTGVTFAVAAGGTLEAYSGSGWTTVRTCPNSVTAGIESLALRVAFTSNPGDCDFEIYRPVLRPDWDVTTRLDFLPLPGRSAGLRVAGSKGSIRLVRYSLNGPAIAFIYDGRTLIGKPDLNGSPTIYLQLASKAGKVSASFSADNQNFEQLPVSVSLAELGTNIRGGLRFSTSTTDQEEPSSTTRFYWYREGIHSLSPYR